MKTIICILIAVIVISIPLSALPLLHSKAENKIKMAAVDSNPQVSDLTASAEIFENRLKAIGLKNFETQILRHEASIQINFQEDINLKAVSSLLLAKGDLQFYETNDRSIVVNKLEASDSLFSLMELGPKDTDNIRFNAELGTCKKEDFAAVVKELNRLLQTKLSGSNIEFACPAPQNSDDNIAVFVLKKGSGLDGKYVSEARSQKGKFGGNAEIFLTFDEEGTKLWRDLTKKNLNKSIAIVLDQHVVAAPIVRSEISGGKAVITGAFTNADAAWMATLIENGKLPLDFEVR